MLITLYKERDTDVLNYENLTLGRLHALVYTGVIYVCASNIYIS